MSWKEIYGWFQADDAWVYREMVSAARDGHVIAEVGVAYGRSLALLCELIEASGKVIPVHAFDTFAIDYGDPPFSMGSHFETTREMLRRYGPPLAQDVPLIKSDSAEAAEAFADRSVFGVFLDADHSYEGVKRDLEAWRRKVVPGGIIGGHDFSGSFPGVEQAVREMFGDRVELPRGNGCSWMVRL